MAIIRVNNRLSAMDQGAVIASQNNSYSGAQKIVPVGPSFPAQPGNTYVSGVDVSSGGSVSPWSILWLYNNSSSVGWVALGTAAPSTPSGFSNGIPLAPNSWTQLGAGPNSFIKTSASTIGLYVMSDDTYARDNVTGS